MALDFGDLDDYLDPSMTFGWDHKKYTIPPVSAALGLWGRKVLALALDPDNNPDPGPPPIPEGQTLEEALLSPGLHAELLADKVPDEVIKHTAKAVYGRVVGGDDLAKAFFEGKLNGPTNRAERRAVKKAAAKPAKKAVSSSRTTSTAAASTTRKAASGSTTKGQPTKSAKASPGRKSSNAGRS